VAVKSAILALNGSVVPADNGIKGNTCEETIRNLGRVSMPGMLETDKVILETMMEKNCS
jgi:L-cysteine desulfidase